MILLASLLPKLLVFAVASVIGGSVAYVGVSLVQDRAPVSTAGRTPEFVMAGAPDSPGGTQLPAAFDIRTASQPAAVLAALPEAELALAAQALIGTEPVSVLNPVGFPRVTPITQFDGGPFQGANCTLASGAMLADLAFGIVTNGTVLRGLQDDQDGGTGLDDLGTALWRGFGISMESGMLRPQQLKALLSSGYGAVIQGDYARIPAEIRLQPSFTGSHAIYVDGYYPGDAANGIPEAYFVIDPIGRPKAGYAGEWWPASIVDDFATAFGGGRIAAMWAFPPGGTPPSVLPSNVPPIPASGGNRPGETPAPTDSPAPGETPGIELPAEPGNVEIADAPVVPPLEGPAVVGGIDLVPILEFCLVDPRPAACPSGIEGIFEVFVPPIVAQPLGPEVSIRFVDSDRPNVALVGFTVDPPATVNVRYWEADGTPATVMEAGSMGTLDLMGETTIVARLNVFASTTYYYQVVAGDGIFATTSPVGTFTTGGGVVAFDVALSSVASPVYRLTTSYSPYLRLAPDAYAEPLVPIRDLGSVTCVREVSFGGLELCLEYGSTAPSTTCTRAQVSYELAGIEATSVLVRAFPTEKGVLADGSATLTGVLEAAGPAGSGNVSVGCLASGLSYLVVIDAVGDDGGVLASREITVP